VPRKQEEAEKDKRETARIVGSEEGRMNTASIEKNAGRET